MSNAPEPFTPAALQLFKSKAINPGIAMQVGVAEDGGRLVYPTGRFRSLDGRGRKHDQPKGTKLEPWMLYAPEEGGSLILCEGETDALAAASALGSMTLIGGKDPGLWSIPGTGTPTGRVVEALRESGAQTVIVATDADEAGDKWAEKFATELAETNLHHRRIELPLGSDLSDVLAGVEPGDRGETLGRLLAPPPVADTGELLDLIARTVRRFVVLGQDQLHAIALWVLHTYAIEAADTTPYLSITSPEKRCGKSLLLDVLSEIVARPMMTANASNAAIFRSLGGIDETGLPVTLLFDELDAIFGKTQGESKEELRGLINAGHRRGSPVYRCTGEKMDTVKAFPVFGPKALAGIGGPPDTIADRSIPISLRRKSRGETVDRGRVRIVQEATRPVKEQAPRWAERVIGELADSAPDLPEKLSDRAQDGAEPLLAIADLAGGDWPEKARASLVDLHASKAENAEEDGWGIRLLADVRAVFDHAGVDRLGTHDLLEALKADEEAPWGDWGKSPDGLKPRGLAKLLRRYGIHPDTIRFDAGLAKGYKRENFEDAWRRYLPAPPASGPGAVTSVTSAPESQKSGLFDPEQDGQVTEPEQPSNPHSNAVVTHVPAETPDQGSEAELAAEGERLAEKFGEAA